MSETIANYSFLPYLRQGISANSLLELDNYHNKITVNLPINGVRTNEQSENPVETISKSIKLYGPGDIIGIDSKAWIKTEPNNGITNFESNYLPYIEFYDEDFPWRYSLGTTNETDRLMPWLALVVLKADEFSDGNDVRNKPLPYITVKNTAESFPLHNQLWAWAHVHINGELTSESIQTGSDNTVKRFKEILNNNPNHTYSRLLCPRKLSPNTEYTAFLIPVYELGRRAGLGITLDSIDNPEMVSWENSSVKEFPYYHTWKFQTATLGDFEYLVELLEPKPVDNRVGKRKIKVKNPAPNITGISENDGELELYLGGALKVPNDNIEPIPGNFPHIFQTKLAEFINLAAYNGPKQADENENINNEDPVITSPLYGRWQASVNRLLKDEAGINLPNNQNWIHNLSLDPRHRATAAFGTQVIQNNKDDYLQQAWKQVGDIMEANAIIRKAQLSKAVLGAFKNKFSDALASQSIGQFIAYTSPVANRVISSEATVAKEDGKLNNKNIYYNLQQSAIPNTITSMSVRKVMRPGSKVYKKLQFAKRDELGEIVTRLNNKEIRLSNPKSLSTELPGIESNVNSLKPNNLPQWTADILIKYKWIKYIPLALSVLFFLLLILLKQAISINSVLGSLAAIMLFVYYYLNKTSVKIEKSESASVKLIQSKGTAEELINDLPKCPDFKISTTPRSATVSPGETDSREAFKFKEALKNCYAINEESIKQGIVVEKNSINIQMAVSDIQKTIHPKDAMQSFIYEGLLKVPPSIKRNESIDIGELLAEPDISDPMYKPLSELSTDNFLPNINFIGQNTISLLETNQEFIEAYMVGINDAFSNRLFTNEYPTKRRGTPCRQFWNISNALLELDIEMLEEEEQKIRQDLNSQGFEVTDELVDRTLNAFIKDKYKDIPKIHKWSKKSKLGEHDNREQDRKNKSELVLVIRGELLKKFPTAVIYAQKARWNDKNGEPDTDVARELYENIYLDDEQTEINPEFIKTPLYDAKVEPDIYFFGFDLDIDEAKGYTESDIAPDNPADKKTPSDLLDNAGWFFVIKERPGEPRFGLDIGNKDEISNQLSLWEELTWEHVTSETDQFINMPNSENPISIIQNLSFEEEEKTEQYNEDKLLTWNENMISSELAYILYQTPSMVAVHASKMLQNLKKE